MLEVIQGHSIINFGTQPGTVLDLHASAHGKVALAFGPQDLLKRCLSKPLKAWTSKQFLPGRPLERAIAQVKLRGWATAPNQVLQGINGLAAPIFNHASVFAGAIAMAGTVQTVPGSPSARTDQSGYACGRPDLAQSWLQREMNRTSNGRSLRRGSADTSASSPGIFSVRGRRRSSRPPCHRRLTRARSGVRDGRRGTARGTTARVPGAGHRRRSQSRNDQRRAISSRARRCADRMARGQRARHSVAWTRASTLFCVSRDCSSFWTGRSRLREMRRVLSRGGRLALSVWSSVGFYNTAVGEALEQFAGKDIAARFHASRNVPARRSSSNSLTRRAFRRQHSRQPSRGSFADAELVCTGASCRNACGRIGRCA